MAASRLASPERLDDLLLYRMARLLAVAGGMVVKLCEGRFGITRREWRVLASLAGEDGLLSSQLAERAQLDRARTSRAIGSLAAKKLVVRETGASDRRQARVTLTAQGRALYDGLFPLVQVINAELLSALGDADVDRLDAMFDALQSQADRLVSQAELPKAVRYRGRGPKGA